MKTVFKPGERKECKVIVQESDVVAFQGKIAHHTYATFSLVRDVECMVHQFVLEMCDGTTSITNMLSIDHKNPAFVDEEVAITVWVDQVHDQELICFFEARVEDRIIAIGKIGQVILKKGKAVI